MARYIFITFLFMLSMQFPYAFAQDDKTAVDHPVDYKDAESTEKSINVNIDAKMLYGKYNNIFSDLNITQELKSFSYQLNSIFKRSNDYGYANTSFFNSEIGFTGMAAFTDTWKFSPLVEMSNDSHGMYKNQVFSREEKDFIVAQIGNEYTPTPSRWNFVVGGAHFIHRLISNGTSFATSQSFYKINGQIDWEYEWTPSIRAKFSSKASHYDYSTGSDNDTYVSAEFIGSFKLTENVKIGLGPVYCWNRDVNHFVAGKASINTVNVKYLSIDLGYQYDLKPFEPENLYNNQKLIMPSFRLPPGKVHRGDCKIGIEIRNESSDYIYIKSFKIKGIGSWERNSNYQNFNVIYENILSPHVMTLMTAKGKGETSLDIQIGKSWVRIGGSYEYIYYRSSKNVTYKPEYIGTAMLKLKIDRFGMEWNNSLIGSVYVDPYSTHKLGRIIFGTVNVDVKLLETFSLYGRIDNIYNVKYYYRLGYPEPGILFIGGIKIQI